jgi:hypothetical protein
MLEKDFRGRETETFENARAEGVDQHIRGREDAEEDLSRLGLAQVEGDGGLATS